MILDIILGLVKVGMEAYSASQASEADALVKLDAALAGARVRVKAALEQLDSARSAADAKLAASIAARQGK